MSTVVLVPEVPPQYPCLSLVQCSVLQDLLQITVEVVVGELLTGIEAFLLQARSSHRQPNAARDAGALHADGAESVACDMDTQLVNVDRDSFHEKPSGES
jgi:hypothetical protein